MAERKTVEQDFGYRIYDYKGSFYVETVSGKFAQGFDTLQGAREHAYYMGYRKSKD